MNAENADQEKSTSLRTRSRLSPDLIFFNQIIPVLNEGFAPVFWLRVDRVKK